MKNTEHYQNSIQRLIAVGAIDINTEVFHYDMLEHLVLNSNKVSMSSRKVFLGSSQYLYNMFCEQYYSESFLVLKCNDIEDLGLVAPREPFSREHLREYVGHLTNFVPDEVHWDDLVDLYYEDKVHSALLMGFWEESFSTDNYSPEHKLQMIASNQLNREKFVRPGLSYEKTLTPLE